MGKVSPFYFVVASSFQYSFIQQQGLRQWFSAEAVHVEHLGSFVSQYRCLDSSYTCWVKSSGNGVPDIYISKYLPWRFWCASSAEKPLVGDLGFGVWILTSLLISHMTMGEWHNLSEPQISPLYNELKRMYVIHVKYLEWCSAHSQCLVMAVVTVLVRIIIIELAELALTLHSGSKNWILVFFLWPCLLFLSPKTGSLSYIWIPGPGPQVLRSCKLKCI